MSTESASGGIVVKSHVARDLLQSAGLFRTDKLVVWEYVSNGLQYVEPGTNPVVRVSVDSRRKRIEVADNGRGMDWQGLQNFFVMHGENVDRAAGRPGRGRFGTGKSAAFGIADLLRIAAVRDGRLSTVELRRSAIESMSSGEAVPVSTIAREVRSELPNGTRVEIEGIHLRSLDQAAIIQYIERHLARWSRNATVFVNNHECEYNEPPVARTVIFKPEHSVERTIGSVELVLKVSKIPLETDFRGVSIFSNGVWHETTLAGCEGRDMSQYIFGEIEVPGLDEDSSPISPFDMSRSMRLNTNNPTVQTLFGFLGFAIDSVRRELVSAEGARRAEEEAKKLAKQASEIARVINEDFAAFRRRLAQARAMAGSGSDELQTPAGGEIDDFLIPGGEIPAAPATDTGGPGSSGQGGGGGEVPRDLGPLLKPGSSESDLRGQPAGGAETSRKPRGGFDVVFERMGTESHRAQYFPDRRTIYIKCVSGFLKLIDRLCWVLYKTQHEKDPGNLYPQFKAGKTTMRLSRRKGASGNQNFSRNQLVPGATVCRFVLWFRVGFAGIGSAGFPQTLIDYGRHWTMGTVLGGNWNWHF